jgi:hypothetical protein
MTAYETDLSPDYTGLQQAIETQLQGQGWCEIHTEARGDQLIIEAHHLADMPGECPKEETRGEERRDRAVVGPETGERPRWL